MNMRGWIVGCCLAVVLGMLSSGCTQSRLARFGDNTGPWRVEALHEGLAGRAPAREFLVDIVQEGEPGLFEVRLNGVNSHGRWMRTDGGSLASARGERLVPSTLLGCGRIDVAIGEPMFEANRKCERVMRDEDLILGIISAPSQWALHHDVLTIRSNSANAWIDLRRRE